MEMANISGYMADPILYRPCLSMKIKDIMRSGDSNALLIIMPMIRYFPARVELLVSQCNKCRKMSLCLSMV